MAFGLVMLTNLYGNDLPSTVHYLRDYLTNIQSNFNCSNTFGTMKISSRLGYFEPVRVDKSVRSEGLIGVSFPFSYEGMLCVLIRIA